MTYRTVRISKIPEQQFELIADRVGSESIFISIPTERSKWILDTRIFEELRNRYEVHIFGGLSERRDFIDGLKSPEIFLHPELTGHGFAAAAVLKIYNAARVLGFKYKRRHNMRILSSWNLAINFRQTAPPERRSLLKRQSLVVLAFLASKRPIWTLIQKLTSRLVIDHEFRRLIKDKKPIAVIVTGQPTTQEIIFALSSKRSGVKSVLIPVSPDDVIDRAYLMTDYFAIAAWGPVMRRNIEDLHEVPSNGIFDSGMLNTRLQRELVASGGYDVRVELDIPAKVRIVTYLSVANMHTLRLEPDETFSAVDALSSAVRDGTLDNAVIVLRTSPWEDAGPITERYRNDPDVRVQDAGAFQFDSIGTAALAGHAALLHASSVVIIGSFTSSLFPAATWGIPIILNQARNGGGLELISPSQIEDADLGTLKAGLPVARSLEDLVQLTKSHINDPELGTSVWETIASEWDYQADDYVEVFAELLKN